MIFDKLKYSLEELFKNPPLAYYESKTNLNTPKTTNSTSKEYSNGLETTEASSLNKVDKPSEPLLKKAIERSNHKWGKITQFILSRNNEKFNFITDQLVSDEDSEHTKRAPFYYEIKDNLTLQEQAMIYFSIKIGKELSMLHKFLRFLMCICS